MPATNADVIAATLAAEGVEYAFGLPGGEVVVLIDALRRAGIKFFLVGHEASAAFMGDVTGQITGRAGVCVSTLGPGATNLVTGVACAFLERSPVLALTAQISHDLFPSFTHQRLPLDRLFGGITKRSSLLDGTDVGAEVAAALRLARSDRPGPVHLAIPSDVAVRVLSSPAGAVSVTDPGMGGDSGGAGRGGAGSGAQADEVLRAIQEARRPLVLIGVGARPTDGPSIRRLLETTQWAWMSTPKAKGIVRESDPRFLGVAGGMAIDRVILETIEASTLLIGIGFDPVECVDPWFLERPVVNITRWSTREGSYQPVEVVGDIGVIASDLAARLAPQPWPEALLQERRRAVVRRPKTSGTGAGPNRGLSPLAALQALRDVLPEETVVACDVGSHKLLAGQFWRTTMPHTFFMSNGLSSMGYGLPAAMAASLHFPNRPVAALVGDGGMLMMSHNLPLIASLKLPILTVVLTDGSLSLIRFAQTRRNLPPYGTDFAAPDFTHFAASCGIAAARATTLEAVKLHAGRALATRAPFLLDVPIDLREYEDLI